MFNKKGGIAIKILILLVVIVVTSASILLLIRYEVLNVNEGPQEQILNTEFIPSGREGTVAVKDFSFCSEIDDSYKCIGPRSNFLIGERIHLRFTIETTPYNEDVIIVQNSRVLGPDGNVILEAESKSDYEFIGKSNSQIEDINFRDFLISEDGDELGTYTFELLIANPILDKRVKIVEEFVLR